MKMRFVVFAVAVLFALAGAPSGAQTGPTPSPSPTPQIQIPNVPTNQIINDVIDAVVGHTTGSFGYDPNRVIGTVTYFNRFDMQVRLQLNKYSNVRLHQGTVIDPRGWTIRSGQSVDVRGHTDADGTFEADSITVHN